ncbi:biotin--[acetyl-CoA-carboxylase] ligase [Pseudofulvibacter geojedonensis]|uniref:Biotin--[acetyl-CoA-carboxylase] ligase n=1 Tax=Pseudofulvibacter geojedonensis TaxID=1123758 RepID=A0ABW3I5N7_9FLAO
MKLHTIESTNDYLKLMSLNKSVEDFTVIVANRQTKGRGQLGSKWKTEDGKNLTYSVFIDTSFISLDKQFYLNCAVSVSLFNVLKKLMLPNLKIKWPNDILSDNYKICGILIENIVKNVNTTQSIIGVGLNVNQLQFEYKKASSLKKLTGIHYSLDEILILLITELKSQVDRLRTYDFKLIESDFKNELFRLNKPSTFQTPNKEVFIGIIKDVTDTGKLQVLLEDEEVKEFGLKEVKLLY